MTKTIMQEDKIGLFNRNKARIRDAPAAKKRGDTPQKQLEDFIRGVDLDENANCGAWVVVDEMRAMQTSAVYACVKILAETVASLPLHLCRRIDSQTLARAEGKNIRKSAPMSVAEMTAKGRVRG